MSRRHTRGTRALATVAALASTAVLWGPAQPADAAPTSSRPCISGQVSCVEDTVAEMQARFAPLALSCDHDAVFALAYLRTTEVYLESTTTPGYFEKPRLVNVEDAVFARMYFVAYDSWAAGRVNRVPPAWRVAFKAADGRRVSGTGDLLLGMSAHVNRDLPFVLAKTGLVAPDGTSRKPDHDKINVMLEQVVEPLLIEEAARFDPQLAMVQTPYGVGYKAMMQMLVAWRENAWQQAERLVSAPTPAARARVAKQIETAAEITAHTLRATTLYQPPLTTTQARDRYCARHGNP